MELGHETHGRSRYFARCGIDRGTIEGARALADPPRNAYGRGYGMGGGMMGGIDGHSWRAGHRND
jgi:hypothetical protein